MFSKVILEFKAKKNIKEIIFNTGWLFADRIVRMGLGLFVAAWVARYLGVQQFGTYNFASAFVGLFAPFSTLGLPSLVIRTITHKPDDKNQILGTVFCLQLLGGVITLALSVLVISLFRHDPLVVSIVFVLSMTGIFQAFDVIDYWFQSQLESKYTVFAKNAAYIVIALVQIVLINIHAPLIAFAAAYLGNSILGALGLILAYKIQGYSLWLWRWSLSLAKSLLRESWFLLLSGLAVMIYVKIDQVMLGAIRGNEEVGLYSAAARISEIWYFIPIAICSSVAPSIYSAKREATEDFYFKKIEQLLRLLSLIAITISLPIAFLSEKIIVAMFGVDYSLASSMLSIHIWASLFVFMGVGASSWFISEGLTHFSFRNTLTGAIVNVLLNFILIPKYGGIGASVATLISYAIGSVFANFFSLKTRKIFLLQIKSVTFFRLKFTTSIH
jgi:PST family polysaccharide transporter